MLIDAMTQPCRGLVLRLADEGGGTRAGVLEIARGDPHRQLHARFREPAG